MNASEQPWRMVPPIVAVAMVLMHLFGGAVDKILFEGWVRGSYNPPYLVEKREGVRHAAWSVRSVSHGEDVAKARVPMVVSLGDDAEGIFQSVPHAPIDLALVFHNMRRLGAREVAAGCVLAWNAPDAMGLVALERAMAAFDSVVTSVPLTRGATSEPMPAAFRKASLPADVVKGSVAGLEVVNRMAIPGALLGGENALAGFTSIEPSDGAARPLLIARWEDRVVFSFPLLAALRLGGHDLESLEIEPGGFLRVGAEGLAIPLDAGGRLGVDIKPVHVGQILAAEQLIDAEETAPSTSGMWLLRDDRSALEAVFRKHSAAMVPTVHLLASDAGMGAVRHFHVLPEVVASLILIGMGLIYTALAKIGGFAMHGGFLLAFFGLGAMQWLAFALGSMWLPGLPAAAGWAAGWLWCIRSRPDHLETD